MNKGRRNRLKADDPSAPGAVVRAAWRVDEWAEQIGCCRATVYNLANRGEIEIISVGRMSFVRPGPSEYLDRKAAERA